MTIAGSTAAAILPPGEYEARFRKALYERLDVANEGWFPAGLTAHEGVSRLLCNHRLDLRSMSAARHWPQSAPVRTEDPTAAVDKVAASIRDNLDCVFSNVSAALALTGGSDSRARLSLARDRRQKITTYVVDAHNPNTDIDIYLSSQIARRFGVNHKVITPLPSDPAIQQRWRYRAAHAVGGGNAVSIRLCPG